MLKGMFKKTKYVPVSLEEAKEASDVQEVENAPVYDNEEADGSQPTVPEGLFIKCKICRKTVYRPDFEENLFVCPQCGKYHRVYAKSRIRMTIDEGTFEPWDTDMETVNPID